VLNAPVCCATVFVVGCYVVFLHDWFSISLVK